MAEIKCYFCTGTGKKWWTDAQGHAEGDACLDCYGTGVLHVEEAQS